MSSHRVHEQKTHLHGVEIEPHLLDEVVGAASEQVTFTTYQDRIDASTRYKDAISQFGLDSTQARNEKARLDDVISRLHPMDR